LRQLLRFAFIAVLAAAPLTASAQTDDVTGNQFVADNATTASTAAATAPLSTVGVDGSSQSLNLPAGFHVSQIASGLKNPRFMAFDQAGNLLVADAGAGSVYRYPASGGAIASSTRPPDPLITGLDAPSNVALHGGYVYVGETSAISRFTYEPSGGAGPRELVVPNLPRGGHSTRTVTFGPDDTMYVSVGSSCNICDESDERRAAILAFAPDGSAYQRFAYGLRNAVGLAIQPATGLLWASVNERDNQGNEIPPDLLTIVRQGQNFGWPGCQPPNATPQDPGRDCSGITPPTIGLQAHGAALGIAFYSGAAFPADYANDLLVVQHGSWNREPPAEPKLTRVHFEGNRPTAAMDFMTGFQRADGSRWGRPAGVTVAPDGSVLVSDDQAGTLYRITYAA